jgi:ABC-2 type transport system permease protein
MNVIIHILQKEFRQIFRNRSMLPIIFVAPVIQLIILSYAVTFEIKHLRISLVDFDQSATSISLASRFRSTGHFIVVQNTYDRNDADEYLERNYSDLILEIPPQFEEDLVKNMNAGVMVTLNAIDGMKAGVAVNYMQSIIAEFTRDFNLANINLIQGPPAGSPGIMLSNLNWFNENLDYKTFMVPGILVLLLTLIGGFLSSMNIVREKEIGTIEQINVTPIRKHQFIIGKLLPFWIIGIGELTLGLLLMRFLFQIQIVGNIGILYLFASVYLLAILGFGLFISTITETQQQAMFVSWFFLVIFILMSGLFTAIENMPPWAQMITMLNPLRYFIEVVRMVILKGSGFRDITTHLSIIMAFALIINVFAIWRYRKTS